MKVQPLLSIARAEDEMKEKEEELKKAMEEAAVNEQKRKVRWLIFCVYSIDYLTPRNFGPLNFVMGVYENLRVQ